MCIIFNLIKNMISINNILYYIIFSKGSKNIILLVKYTL